MMDILYLKPEEQVVHEIAQSRHEGKEVAAIEKEWNSLVAKSIDELQQREIAIRLLVQLGQLLPDHTLLLNEPSDLDGIRLKSRATEPDISRGFISEDTVLDKIHGGWLGRAAGCLLGKPVEKFGRKGIREILYSNNRWPLSDYFTAKGVPPELLVKYPWNRHGGVDSLKENIRCMPEDDDMNYPIVNLLVAQQVGPVFTTEQLANIWLQTLPVLSTFTAERVAYVNCLKLLPIDKCATSNNPYREWIGAQIRADMWGWLTIGNPLLASEYAWRDASLSHTRNGIYGEMFFAAAIAQAGVSDDIENILQSAFKVVPSNSRFANAINTAMAVAKENHDWETILDKLYHEFKDYYWVHTLNNAALVVAGLIYGNGDFERTICSVVMGGWDADCNGATAGSILGTMHGAQRLPTKWISPLNNCLRSSAMGFDHSPIDQLAQTTAALYEHFSNTA